MTPQLSDIVKSSRQANEMKIEDFEYDLPPELIAQEPLANRDQSRLLYLNKDTGATEHLVFDRIADILQAGDVLVVNDTRVIPARLLAHRATGGQIKLLLLKPEATNPGIWEALVTPIKRLKPGEELIVENKTTASPHRIQVVDIITGVDGFKRLLVNLGTKQDVFTLLSSIGVAPLPPYIKREWDERRDSDLSRYQTVYATTPGAVAAPTAGLHFSQPLIERLTQKGILVEQLTLHVGPGTFKPIAEGVDDHTIEAESFIIPAKVANTVNSAKKARRRIIAVGTTSMRALESAGKSGTVQAVEDGVTELYIKPGYDFKIVDGMITNFHLSRSSLLVLVAAFAGRDKIMQAYGEAIERGYRFYSYGDAMLIL